MPQQTARTPEQISAIMRKVKSRDTQIETTFRKAVWRRGLRFRVDDKRLPGRPDVVLASRRLAVFLDGDYWHGHQWRKRGLTSLDQQFDSNPNADYWKRKITRNIFRDFRNTAALLEDGWSVLRFWESDLQVDFDACVEATVAAAEHQNRSPSPNALVPRLAAAEFFAGIGLVRLGLEPSWNVVFANDLDPKKLAMYEANFGAGDFTLADIHHLTPADVPPCSLFTASFPCNDLSLAGAREGLQGKESSAFWGLIEIVEGLGPRKPPLILFENVPGFLTSHKGRDFEQALLALNRLGYVCDTFQLDAASWTPQSRTRLFIVARFGEAQPQSVLWKIDPCPVRPAPLATFINAHDHIQWDIRRLPPPPRRSDSLESILEDLTDDDPAWWNEERADYFFNQLSDRHRAIADEMIERDECSYGAAFRRVRKGRSMAELRVDGLAGCLRTPRGGSGRQILFKAGRGRYQVRLLTARECARLQGVADTYEINVPLNQALFGFGDAVCVPAIQWISDNYLIPAASEMIRGRLLTLA